MAVEERPRVRKIEQRTQVQRSEDERCRRKKRREVGGEVQGGVCYLWKKRSERNKIKGIRSEVRRVKKKNIMERSEIGRIRRWLCSLMCLDYEEIVMHNPCVDGRSRQGRCYMK